MLTGVNWSVIMGFLSDAEDNGIRSAFPSRDKSRSFGLLSKSPLIKLGGAGSVKYSRVDAGNSTVVAGKDGR